MISREEVQKIKDTYRPGMRIRLIEMDDIQAPPFGTKGTIIGVDDIGMLLVSWDNGSSLNVVLSEDKIEILK